MKRNILFLTLSALCILSACSNDDEEWRYGEEQALNATEWIRIGAVYDAAESFSPIRFPKEQTLSFGENDFTMTAQGSIYDEKSNSMCDTTITTHGSYEYKHPTNDTGSEPSRRGGLDIGTKQDLFLRFRGFLRVPTEIAG